MIDLTGQRFGRLTVITRADNRNRRIQWLCRCDCGNEKSIGGEALRYSLTISCGCFAVEAVRERSLKHGATTGYTTSREYRSWTGAKGRCFNRTDQKYPRYGARGISMCRRWADDFGNFIEDMGECPPGKTLDRIDVNGDYEPGNCRWATHAEQARNTTQNLIVYHDGVYMSLAEYAEILNLSYGRLRQLIRRSKFSLADATARMTA